MNRRRFLQLLGISSAAVALEQAIPFGRVWSFPKEIVIARPSTVRFIRARDYRRPGMIARLDVLYGHEFCELPGGIECAEAITVARDSLIPSAIDQLQQKFRIPNFPAIEQLKLAPDPTHVIKGVWYDLPPSLA